MKPLLIISDRTGQLGNTLLVSSHIIAHAIEYGLNVVNIPFDDYAQFFNGTRHNLLCSYPLKIFSPFPESFMKRLMIRGRIIFLTREIINELKKHKFTSQVSKKYMADIIVDWSQHLNLDSYEFQELKYSKTIIILSGWNIRAPLSIKKHSEQIREYFKPLPRYRKYADSLVSQIKSNYDVLVGVHIRQGDYRNWLGGQFFYETSFYLKLTQDIETLFYPKRVLFLICSNLQQNEYFMIKENIAFGSGQVVEDLYALSQCDYILGPPSTFSTWASFYGKRPLYHIYDSLHIPTLKDFQIVTDLNYDL